MSVQVGNTGDEAVTEIPAELSGPPGTLPTLTSISLTRVFRTGEIYNIVTGNYGNDGKLGSLNIANSQAGNIKNNVIKSQVSADDPDLLKYRIPAAFDQESLSLSRPLHLPAANQTESLQIVNRIFGFSTMVREDVTESGHGSTSRYLSPARTSEQERLEPECNSRVQQQHSSGLPTV